MTDRQIELVWRCSSCQHQSLGRHAVCQGCGNPKDDSEEYEMPADPSAVASVTDPALLAIATGGENWSCKYCGSHQRNAAGECKQCGGEKVARATNARADAADPREARPARPSRRLPFYVLGAILGASLLTTCVLLARRPHQEPAPVAPVAVFAPPARTTFTASVTSVSWKRTVSVETRQLVAHEDFTSDVPAGAVELHAAGQHVHHEEQVLDHNETVYDDVEVPDGFRTESYTERVSCGQDCKTIPRTCKRVCSGSPRTCKQKCTNNKNGFASCKEECTGSGETCRDDCTGGNQSCTTKYCDERRTRQIPKTRTEKRARIIPRYRSEPRYAAWSAFKLAEWVRTGGDELTGDDVSPVWPDAGIKEADAGSDPPKLGTKRIVRTESATVTLRTDDGATHPFVPSSLDELPSFAVGSAHRVRVEGAVVTLLGDE
jgi:hypothetical protein